MNKKDKEILSAMLWHEEQEDKEREEEVRSQNLRCKNCGEHITQYGPETFHVESTMIRCMNGETRAEVTLKLECKNERS